jgi:hypothetical protein
MEIINYNYSAKTVVTAETDAIKTILLHDYSDLVKI